jgi:hypothetical protein
MFCHKFLFYLYYSSESGITYHIQSHIGTWIGTMQGEQSRKTGPAPFLIRTGFSAGTRPPPVGAPAAASTRKAAARALEDNACRFMQVRYR